MHLLTPFCLIVVVIFSTFLARVPGAVADGYICEAPDVWIDEQEALLLQLVNEHRLANGLEPLGFTHTLISAAGWMSGDMAWRDYFSHTDWFGRTVNVRQSDCGNWSWTKGENIAAGFYVDNAYAVMDMWRNSSGHNAQMLNPNFRYAGISRFHNPWSMFGWYWVMDLASD